ncbi:hypothetical protein NQ317_013313 [Molorchus minor]|uniref:Peptidase M12B domain-containing protein n=1 Tax=Molorchus minor TaxID=1323400 RepID=A0ABQ9JA39_9CUCU|nr:hypothetical protein NQ317_013313 [Molorchus minor]
MQLAERKIIEVIKSRDGQVRRAKVQTATTILERPVVKLVPLNLETLKEGTPSSVSSSPQRVVPGGSVKNNSNKRLDFWAYEKGRNSYVTMGLATVGGVCLDKYACVIAEFGTTNIFGKPYPSAGFTSVYISAHEIGHNLGMHHDSSGNQCPKDGYIMSPSRGTNGETQWSTCSADVMTKLGWAKCLQDPGKSPKKNDHSQFLDSPGHIFTAKQQCEILLRDKDAMVLPNQQLSSICYNLQCNTPHRTGYYFAGPALDGTQCGKGKYCYGGNCVKKEPPKPVKIIPGGWGPWQEGSCHSGCLEKSMGHTMKRRFCNNPAPVHTDRGCEGPSVEFGLCIDDEICNKKKVVAVDYASDRCQEFSKLLPELDSEGAGLQAPHEEGIDIYDVSGWGAQFSAGEKIPEAFYTPRIELNDLGVTPYFPDGTWCHKEENLQLLLYTAPLFTRNNLLFFNFNKSVLSRGYKFKGSATFNDNFRFTKSELVDDDIPFAQNAFPHNEIPQEIKDYLSLGPDGKPIKTTLSLTSVKSPKDDVWETKDYIEVPELQDRYRIRYSDDNERVVKGWHKPDKQATGDPFTLPLSPYIYPPPFLHLISGRKGKRI